MRNGKAHSTSELVKSSLVKGHRRCSSDSVRTIRPEITTQPSLPEVRADKYVCREGSKPILQESLFIVPRVAELVMLSACKGSQLYHLSPNNVFEALYLFRFLK